MTKTISKPNAVCEVVTGYPGRPPIMLKGAHVSRLNSSTGQWEAHPAWALNGNPQLTRRFDIEFVSNVIEVNLGSHLECRGINERNRFCFRAHRGFDQPGIAQRRSANGGLFLTECDPGNCDLRQNAIEPHSRTGLIRRQWGEVYGSYVTMEGQEGDGDKRRWVAPRCMPILYFIFRLLTPDLEYAHPQTGYCLLDSKAETNHGRFMDFLTRAWIDSDGKLAGRRAVLFYDPIVTRFDKGDVDFEKRKPAWNLAHPDDVVADSIAASQRTRALAVDWSQVKTEDIGNALVHSREAHELAKYGEAEALRERRGDALDIQKVEAEKIHAQDVYLINNEPVIAALIERCQINYALETAMPMMWGKNIRRAIQYFQDYAANYQEPQYDFKINKIVGYEAAPIDISDILEEHGWLKSEPPQLEGPDFTEDDSADDAEEVEATDEPEPTPEELDQQDQEQAEDLEGSDAAVRGGESSFDDDQFVKEIEAEHEKCHGTQEKLI